MKHLKKLSAIFLALAMVFALSISVSAVAEDTTTTGTSYINIRTSAPNHSYEAYKILSGTIDPSGDILTAVKWGYSINNGTVDNSDALLTALKADTEIGSHFAGVTDASGVASVLATFSDSSAELNCFAKVVSDYVISGSNLGSCAYDSANSQYSVTGLPVGYYIVKDVPTGTLEDGDAISAYILELLHSASLNPKSSNVTFEKKVKDTNDSDGTVSAWQDSADYDIGDLVPYLLKATLPTTGFSHYESYKLVFTDVMSKGLTFAGNVQATIGGADYTKIVSSDDAGYQANPANYKDYFVYSTTVDSVSKETTLTITIEDVKAAGATAGAVVELTYDAQLNTDAVIGVAGNPNTAKLEYSNNPNGTSLGKTPDDKVTVFTFSVVVHKVDADEAPLPGAVFTLEKYKNEDGTWNLVPVDVDVAGTVFSFNGLDDGWYKLTETQEPTGYNPLEAPIYFKVEAAHDTDSADPKLTKLDVKRTLDDGTLDPDNTVFNITDRDPMDGIVNANIVNHKGATLPSTGGMGTTLFYLAGGLMVACAGVLLVTKKRMSR